mgnify:CR=1 FL=1
MVKYRNCMKTNETTISKNIIHKGKVINFGVDEITLPNGNTTTREYVEHPGGAAILKMDLFT